MARTSKSLATGTVFSTIGPSRIPGMTICSPDLRKTPWRLGFASRMAPVSSVEVRYLVRFSCLRATDGMLSPRWARYRSEPGGAIAGAGSSGFLVASAFTCTNTPCGFCTAAAGGEKKAEPIRASRNRKAVTLAIESLDFESLNWAKRILQRGNLLLLCTGSNLGCQLRRAKLVKAYRTWAQGWVRAGGSSRSLQTIAPG